MGFRLATRRPDRIAGLVVQNGNAYLEGLSDSAPEFVTLPPEDPGTDAAIRGLLTLDATRSQYETGVGDRAAIAPDGWTLDEHLLDRPGRTRPMLDLAHDYRSNLELYPRWQAWMRSTPRRR